MKVEKYHLKSEETFTVFEFISEGPNGAIKKLIHFQSTSQTGLYNLAFGDRHIETGEIDDLAISNNGDTDKVLGTVVAALYTFFDYHSHALVYATGSTSARQGYIEWALQDFMGRYNKTFAYLDKQQKVWQSLSLIRNTRAF